MLGLLHNVHTIRKQKALQVSLIKSLPCKLLYLILCGTHRGRRMKPQRWACDGELEACGVLAVAYHRVAQSERQRIHGP